jgi:hypothetical protein
VKLQFKQLRTRVYACRTLAFAGQHVSKNKHPEGKIRESFQFFRNTLANGIEIDSMIVSKKLEDVVAGSPPHVGVLSRRVTFNGK